MPSTQSERLAALEARTAYYDQQITAILGRMERAEDERREEVSAFNRLLAGGMEQIARIASDLAILTDRAEQRRKLIAVWVSIGTVLFGALLYNADRLGEACRAFFAIRK